MGKRQSQDNYSCKVFLPTSFSKEVGESLDFFIAKEYYTHMRKIAAFIVKKSVLFFIIFAALVAYGIYGITKVRVEYDITGFLNLYARSNPRTLSRPYRQAPEPGI